MTLKIIIIYEEMQQGNTNFNSYEYQPQKQYFCQRNDAKVRSRRFQEFFIRKL